MSEKDGIPLVPIIFCQNCGSHLVDVYGWERKNDTSEIRCAECGNSTKLKGFTIGKCDYVPNKSYHNARERMFSVRKQQLYILKELKKG